MFLTAFTSLFKDEDPVLSFFGKLALGFESEAGFVLFDVVAQSNHGISRCDAEQQLKDYGAITN